MRYENTTTRRLALGLLLLLAFTSGCEDTDITAPVGSIITVTPSPSAVIIDQVDGEEEAQSIIVAQVTESGGQPVVDLPLFFTSSGGLMASVDNSCGAAGVCTRSPDACTVDADCPLVTPDVILTDSNGVANDILTMRLFGDPDSVVVTVKGTGIEGTATVTKIINTGPVDPVPLIQAIPPGGQRTGLGFIFNGSDSTFDPQEDPTCYDWRLTSSIAIFDPFVDGCEICADPGGALCVTECTTRGPFASTVDFTVGDEGDADLNPTLNVFLKVSGQDNVVCNNVDPVDQNIFGPNIDLLSYDIDCDLTNPFVEAGGDRNESLVANGGEVTVVLTALASDPEDPVLSYQWDCGNGQSGALETVACTYDSEGVFQATVTVENDCERISQDSLIVDIDP